MSGFLRRWSYDFSEDLTHLHVLSKSDIGLRQVFFTLLLTPWRLFSAASGLYLTGMISSQYPSGSAMK